jgi:hypothetical protein
MNRRHNKKGDVNWHILSLVLAVLVFIAAIIGWNQLMKSKDIIKCKNQDGVCASKCQFPTQVAWLSDRAAGCDRGELCCINITRSKPIDPMCTNAEGTEPLPFGTECDDGMYCDMAQVCVNLCEFCSTNVNNKQYENVVKERCSRMTDADKKKFEKGMVFTCGCTQKECTDAPDKCVFGYCPTPAEEVTAPDYACCVK